MGNCEEEMATRTNISCFQAAIRLIGIAVFVCAALSLHSQVIRCKTQEHFTSQLGPAHAALFQDNFEIWLDRTRSQEVVRGERDDSLYSLPLIFHLVHNGEAAGNGRNLSFAQIQSQLDVLNEDFQRMAGTPGYNTHPAGADCQIAFCLASVGEDGSPLLEPGIDRIDRNAFGWLPFPLSSTYIDQVVKPATIWNPEAYVNVWVIELTGSALGYAQYPDLPALAGLPLTLGDSTDGIVVGPTRIGRTGTATAPYNQGRTLTHEMGHFLGLRHIWGDGDCTFDDFCEDTPPSDDGHFGCPAQVLACGGPVQLQNYLEYTDDACMNLFTLCQKGRMRTVLRNAPRRANLRASLVCNAELPPFAAFTSSQQQGCPGSDIQFFDQSGRMPTQWQWSFPGGIPAQASVPNPVVTYPTSGFYDATLIVANSFGSDTLILPAAITIAAADVIFFEEDFEQGFGTFTVDNPDSGTTWDIKQVAGSRFGPGAARIRMYDYPAIGQKDALVSPVFDLSAFQQVSLSFDYAYRLYNLQSIDTLKVWVSADSGATWLLLWANAENGSGNFATEIPLTAGFTPQQPSDWCYSGTFGQGCLSLMWPQNVLSVQSRFKIESVNGYGNNLFLDGIRLEGNCTTTSNFRGAEHNLTFYPNPTQGKLVIRSTDVPFTQVEVWNMQGRRMKRMSVNPTFETEIWLEGLAAGTYIIRVFGKIWQGEIIFLE